MKLEVGDDVVYGAHGAGVVAGRNTKVVSSESQVVVVIALADGLTVELPLALAEELLRPVIGETEILHVGTVLRAEGDQGEETWLKRRGQARAKLQNPVGLAEIVRNAARREHVSPGERELVRTARKLLAAEIAVSRGVEAAEAEGWIDEQLAQT
jgi:RNA polymerase-interacting CarD/CdnL/TRCF family regulator